MSKKEENKKISFNPTNDYVFKRIFGHVGNEEITKGLLSAIMGEEIKDVKLDLDKNKILERDFNDDKLGVLDIRATLNDNVECDIEVQIIDTKDIIERILFYWSKLYSKGIEKGSNNYKILKKVIIILITKYEIEELSKIEKTLTKWQIREENYQNRVLTDKLEFYILELPKYKRYKNISESLSNWVKFIESPGELDMKKIKDENIKKAKEELEIINMDEYEEAMALRREMFLHDQASMKRHAYEDGEKAGFEKGEKSGKKIGEHNSKIEIAKNMLKENIDIEVIVKVTGLSKEEIEKLK